jgi:hypothetical protein
MNRPTNLDIIHFRAIDLCMIMTNKLIYMLTATGLTPGGSSTVQIYIQTTQNDTMRQNTQNGTHVTKLTKVCIK